MATFSTERLVPITRSFLSSYYSKYPFSLSDDVSLFLSEVESLSAEVDLQSDLSIQARSRIINELEYPIPHKIDENMWRNREHIEEIIFLLERPHSAQPLQGLEVCEDEQASVSERLRVKLQTTLNMLVSFQSKQSEHVFNTVMTYMPQDFRGTLIRQQKERSERNRQAKIDNLVNSGGSIRDKYALLWRQQMERRTQLAQLGSATGVYKTLVKYLVGVPQVLLDFVRQINDDHGPMEEQRQHYGPPLYSLTKMVLSIRRFLSLLLESFEATTLTKIKRNVLEQAVDVYTSEFERFIKFIGVVSANSPFFITADEAGALEASDDYKETIIPAGKTHEVLLTVESTNSYIAWDFSLADGKMNADIGFSMEYGNPSGEKTLILPYRRYGSNQGNFCTCMAGNYKLVWDNSYSTFFKKVLRYKVDCIPPVDESK